MDVGRRRLVRVPRQRRDAPPGPDRAHAIPGLVRSARERLERGEVIRAQAQHLMECAHRHLRRGVARGAGCGFGGEEGAGVLSIAAGMRAEGEEALGRARRLAATLAHHGLGPHGRRTAVPAPREGAGHVDGQLVGGGIRDQQLQQTLGGEGVGLARVAGLEVGLARLLQPAQREQLLGLREGARALQREQELLVGGIGRREPTGGEAQLQAARADLRRGQPRLVQVGQLVAAAHGGALAERTEQTGGEAGPAADLDLGQQAGLGERPGEQQREERRRRGREAVEPHVVDVDREPLAIPVEGHLEGEGRALGVGELGLGLEHARTEVQLHLLQLTEPSGHRRQRAGDGLGLDAQLEVAEREPAALVPSGSGADVEGEADVGDLQREVGDRDAWAQGSGGKPTKARRSSRRSSGPGLLPATAAGTSLSLAIAGGR